MTQVEVHGYIKKIKVGHNLSNMLSSGVKAYITAATHQNCCLRPVNDDKLSVNKS